MHTLIRDGEDSGEYGDGRDPHCDDIYMCVCVWRSVSGGGCCWLLVVG